MPDTSNHQTHADFGIGGTCSDAQECEVPALNHRLAELIAQHDRAEGDYLCAANRCNSAEFKARIADDRLSGGGA